MIVRGMPQELDFVRRICRDKIARGVLAILPGNRPASDEVVKLRNERDETRRENETLKDVAGLLVSIAVECKASIPEELTAKLSEYGVIVLSIEESGPDAENSTADTAPESNDPEQMDDKYIEVEDMQEVDLDADDKTPAADDTKDVQTDDAKETTPAKKTSKRSKKSE